MPDHDPEDIGIAPTVESTPRDGAAGGVLERGKRFGGEKYRIEDTLGEGTFGTIYRARDTHLDRDVALEIGPGTDEARARVERDAKLAHPNIVVIYDSGELEGRVFIAREYVGGNTARAWLAAPRPARDILAMFAAAADGLAAAHAAGMVHGSISADAIVIGDDGRPRIGQFGSDDSTAEDDQRAFRATVQDALRGVRGVRGVPRHVAAALHRSWPSVAELARELRRDPGRRRRRIALAAIAVVAIGGTATLALRRGGGPAPCTDDGAALAPVWSAPRAQTIARAFDAIGGTVVWRDVATRFDAYGSAWVTARHDACRATRIDGTQSEALLDQRMLCVDRALAQLDSVLAALAVGDRAALASAPQAAALLPDLSRCADVGAMANETPVPVDPAARAQIEHSIREVADARTSLVWGAKDGVATGDRVFAGAMATSWPPVIAEAKFVRGSLLLDAQEVDRGRTVLEDSANYAVANHLDETAALSMAALGRSHAQAGRIKDARHWLSLAHALWSHLGEPASLGVEVLRGEANVAMDAGQFDVALETIRRVVALSRSVFGETPLDDYNLANALEQKGEYDQAAAAIATGLATAEKRSGKDHPSVARFAYKAAEIEMYRTHFREATSLAKRSIAIGEAWYGRDDVHLIDALEILGATYARTNQADLARATLDRALAILHAHSPDSAEINVIENILEDLEARLGHWDAAVAHGERAAASDVARFGADSPYVMPGLGNLGIAQRHLGQIDASATSLVHAVAIGTKTLGPAAAETINVEVELSYTWLRQGRAREAAAMLEATMAYVDAGKDIPPANVAETYQAFADALWRAGGDRARARASATKARAAYAKLGAEYAEQTKASEAWLASHR